MLFVLLPSDWSFHFKAESKAIPNDRIHIVTEFHTDSGGSEICKRIIEDVKQEQRVLFLIEWDEDTLRVNMKAAEKYQETKHPPPQIFQSLSDEDKKIIERRDKKSKWATGTG